MRRNHQAGRLGSPQLGQIVEAADALGRRIEIEQQHVFVLDGPFHSGNERDAAGPGVFGHLSNVEPAIVQRNRQHVITKYRHPVDQVRRRIRQCSREGRLMYGYVAPFST